MAKSPRYRLTKRTVDALRAEGKDGFVWDRDLPGFGLRVRRSGRKVYVVQTRGPNGSRRVSLGAHGLLSPAEARKQAAVVIGRIKQGEDPKSDPTAPVTVADLVERYLRVHVEPNCKRSSIRAYRSLISMHVLPALGERPLDAVDRASVATLHHALRDRPGAANATLKLLSHMFGRAQAWGLVAEGHQPCRSIRPYRLRAHIRYLTNTEYRGIGETLKDGEASGWIDKPVAAALRLLMLTGCRKNEILTLRWDDVDWLARELRLRDSKTGPCLVALTAPVERVLESIERPPGNPWVIAGARPGTRRKTLWRAWQQVSRRAGLEGMRLHDLRHSYASRALALGEGLPMIAKLLNHVQMQTSARYAHLVMDAEKAAAARVGDAIAANVAGRG